MKKNKQKAFTEQELLDALREGRYKGRNELISLHVIQIALREMDIEYRENAPKATICEHNKFIPRWNDRYNEEVLKSAPSILVFENHYNNVIDILSKFKEEPGSNKLLDYLSKKSNLSVELLKDGNVSNRLLQCFYEICSPKSKDIEKYKIVYSEDCASEIRSTSQSLSNFEFFDEIIKKLQEWTWFYHKIDGEVTKSELLIEFTEFICEKPNALDQIIKDFLKENNLVAQVQEGGNEDRIKEQCKELLLKELPESSPLVKIVEKAIDSNGFRRIMSNCFNRDPNEGFEHTGDSEPPDTFD